MGKDSHASVVVPTRSRPRALARCLDALRRQTLPLELVVVHDGLEPPPAVPRECEAAGALLVRVPQAGPAAARNAGARRASEDLLLLTDDDCEPLPDWAERMIRALERGAGTVAGATVNARPQDALSTATQAIHDHLAEAPNEPFATTNNLGCRRELLEQVPFDESYEFAGEDRDWCARVTAAGWTLEREPAAVVLHRQELTLSTFLRKHAAYGRGSAHFRARHGRGPEPGAFYAGLLRRGFSHGARAGVLVGVAQAAGAYGAAREALSSRR